MSSNHIRAYVLISLLVMTGQSALASGACCSVSPGGKNQASIAVIGSAAWSHEKIGGVTYDLKQQAVMVRGTVPFGGSFFASGTIGTPLRTSLSLSQGTSSGRLGFVYGVGAGVVLPRFLLPLDFILIANYNRSEGRLSSTVGGKDWNARFIISELQGILLGEADVFQEVTLYGGARFYSGRNIIRDYTLNIDTRGEREGNVSPFLGLRGELWDRVSLAAEGSLGHTIVTSLAVIATI